MTDPRLAELTEWTRETGLDLPLPAERIVALEDAGYIVELTDGSLIDAPGSQPAYNGPDVEAWPLPRGFAEVDAMTPMGRIAAALERIAGHMEDVAGAAGVYQWGR